MVLSLVLAGQLAASVPPPTATAPLTLSAAVAHARTLSGRQQAAAVAAEGARAAARVAGRLPNPVLELRAENWPSFHHALDPDLFAVVTQPFELGGKRGLRRRLAVSDADLAVLSLRSLERELALETVRAYIRALAARSLVETRTANRDRLAALVDSIARQVDEGYTAEADLLKFKTEAARIDGEIARAVVELEQSLATLTIATGAAVPIQWSQLIEPESLPLPSSDATTIAAAVARHPDVVAADAGVGRARTITALERARGVPDAAITAGYKRTAGFDTGVIGVLVALPLFDRNDAAVARALGAERAAAMDRDALVHALSARAASLVRATRVIADRAGRAQDELLTPAAGVRNAALAAFREGSADVLRLIDAERVYADVQRTATELRLDALLATIEARFALGEEAIP